MGVKPFRVLGLSKEAMPKGDRQREIQILDESLSRFLHLGQASLRLASAGRVEILFDDLPFSLAVRRQASNSHEA